MDGAVDCVRWTGDVGGTNRAATLLDSHHLAHGSSRSLAFFETGTVGTRGRGTSTSSGEPIQAPSMFVFGSAANADGSNEGGERGKASPSVDVAPSFAFGTSSLPAVTATSTSNSEDATAAGGFKFNVPPSQDLAAPATVGGEAGGANPLFGSTFQSRQVLGPGVKTETKHEEAIHGRQQQQSSGSLPDAVTEEELMNSGHELHESYTCPLCCLPMSLPIETNSKLKACCMKTVCNGCIHASRQSGMGEACPFCRTPTPDSDAARLALVKKRVDAKDPAAMEFLAQEYCDEGYGLQQDIPRAIELWTEAANFGDLNAHYKLGRRYFCGQSVEQDKAKAVRHWQHAAIQGHPESRHFLGVNEYRDGKNELAVRHWMIAAKMGNEYSLNTIKNTIMEGHATKAQYAEALKGYHTALDERKSHQREEADIQHWRNAAIEGHAQREEAQAFFDGGDNM